MTEQTPTPSSARATATFQRVANANSLTGYGFGYDLWRCPTCAALVLGDDTAKHRQWHEATR